MKIANYFLTAALALTFAACSNDDNDIQNPAPEPAKSEGIPFTATISVPNSAATRALAENGTTIEATWADNEVVALIYDAGGTATKTDATVTKQDDGTATISATLEVGATNGSDVTIIYPASAADGTTGNVKSDLLLAQNGTLTGTGSIAENYDVRKGSGKLSISGGKATVNNGTAGTTVPLTNQFSIWKLTLQKGGSDVNAKTLAIRDASNNLLASATLATAGSEFYLAIPAMTSVKILAVNGDDSYSYSKDAVSIAAGKYYQSTVSLNDDITNLSATATANTYLVTAAGKYKFKATIKGNGGIDPITGTTATTIDKASIAGVKVLWELKDQGLAIKYADSNYDIYYMDGYIYFSTPETSQSGDAYVAIYDSSDNILWSWLIWTTEAPTETTYEGLTIMDRNIGALSVTGDTYSAGFQYQWGRKDPFPAGTKYNAGTQYVYVPTRTTAFGYEENADGFTMAHSVAHPATQLGPASDNWLVASEFNVNLWLSSTSTKTIYDPCPIGWRIPTKDELGKVFSSGVTLPGGGAAAGDSKFNSYCNGGSRYYWSSTAVDRANAWCCSSGTLRTANGSSAPDWRLSASMSIRPVKE